MSCCLCGKKLVDHIYSAGLKIDHDKFIFDQIDSSQIKLYHNYSWLVWFKGKEEYVCLTCLSKIYNCMKAAGQHFVYDLRPTTMEFWQQIIKVIDDGNWDIIFCVPTINSP